MKTLYLYLNIVLIFLSYEDDSLFPLLISQSSSTTYYYPILFPFETDEVILTSSGAYYLKNITNGDYTVSSASDVFDEKYLIIFNKIFNQL